MGQNPQYHPCCCLDNTSPRLAFTSTSAAASGCSMSRPEEPVPVSRCLFPPRGLQLLHSQVIFTSQERAHKCTLNFHLQVNFTSQNVLTNAPLIFTCKSTHSQASARKCTLDFYSQVNLTTQNVLANAPLTFTRKSPLCRLHPIRKGSPLWHGSLMVVKSSCSSELDTAIRCHTSCCT